MTTAQAVENAICRLEGTRSQLDTIEKFLQMLSHNIEDCTSNIERGLDDLHKFVENHFDSKTEKEKPSEKNPTV